MRKRSLFLTWAAAFLVSGLGSVGARAASITLPPTVALDPSLATTTTVTPTVIAAVSNGNSAVVAGAETLTFSNFSYTSTATGTATPYPATGVGVGAFTTVPGETGLGFSAGWIAATGGTLDIHLHFVVTAPAGELINDAYLLISGAVVGTGTATAGETITNTATGGFLGFLSASLPTTPVPPIAIFPGVQSVTIDKDILMTGGTATGSSGSISIVDQGFSSTIPEPTSFALLGIGMAGFFTYRRLFKRPATV